MTTDQTGYALARDEGTPMWFLSAAARIKATGDQTGGAYALFDLRARRRGDRFLRGRAVCRAARNVRLSAAGHPARLSVGRR